MCAWVIGNWKQNPATSNEVIKLLKGISVQFSDTKVSDANDLHVNHIDVNSLDSSVTEQKQGAKQVYPCQIMIAPSHIHMALANQQLITGQDTVNKDKNTKMSTNILLAAQDVSAHSATIGAYTGDCSAAQLADLGATWTLIGHSERRLYHNENNEVLQQKIINAFAQGLGVILCVGESQTQRDNHQTHEILSQQLSVIPEVLTSTHVDLQENENNAFSARLIIAYEPIWAIGTGNTPTVEQVADVHKYIKHIISGYHCYLADVPIIYGGSVNANNASQFASSGDISGALVGGASLQAESFLAIAEAFAYTPKQC